MSPIRNQLAAVVRRQADRIVQLETGARKAYLIAELQRRLGADSLNSSKPPSSGRPWDQAGAQALVANAVEAQAGHAGFHLQFTPNSSSWLNSSRTLVPGTD